MRKHRGRAAIQHRLCVSHGWRRAREVPWANLTVSGVTLVCHVESSKRPSYGLAQGAEPPGDTLEL